MARRWWIRGGALAVVGLIVAGTAISVERPGPPPLALPAAAAPVGTTDGAWTVAPGSVAGFRIQQTALGFTGAIVGRTHAVSGTVRMAGTEVASADLNVDLATITVAGRSEPQLALSLDTRQHPNASLRLAQPLPLGAGFAAGAPVTVTAAGRLTLRGVARPVAIAMTWRRNGAGVDAVGTIAVPFADWGIRGPAGFGSLGSLADRGVAEFLLALRRG